MSSGITFSSFNNIDWNAILNAVMSQERQPVSALQQQQSALSSRSSAFAQLATKLSAFDEVVQRLAKPSSLSTKTATNTDVGVATIATTADTAPGMYDVVVTDLARAQVTASSTVFDSTADVVATAGSLTVGSAASIDLAGLTLQQLADKINTSEGTGAKATIVSPETGKYKLVLTGTATGGAGAVTITPSGVTGGKGLAFAANTVSAHDAQLSVNGIEMVSATNVVTGVIPGATLTLLKKGASTTINVSGDQTAAKTALKDLVRTYNDLRKYAIAQSSVGAGDTGKIGHDGLLRALTTQLRAGLGATVGTGTIKTLTNVGITTLHSGELSFSESDFDKAASNPDAIRALFVGTTTEPGIFAALHTSVAAYTQVGGLIASTRDRLDDEADAMSSRISAMEERLEIRRLALQQEYNAADRAMTSLNSQMSALSTIGNEYRLF